MLMHLLCASDRRDFSVTYHFNCHFHDARSRIDISRYSDHHSCNTDNGWQQYGFQIANEHKLSDDNGRPNNLFRRCDCSPLYSDNDQ